MWFSRRKDKRKAEETVDYKNLFESFANGATLFKKLQKQCHPDQYYGTEKEDIATRLFMELNANSSNYSELLKIEERIKEELLDQSHA